MLYIFDIVITLYCSRVTQAKLDTQFETRYEIKEIRN